jgi:hypothetical protein
MSKPSEMRDSDALLTLDGAIFHGDPEYWLNMKILHTGINLCVGVWILERTKGDVQHLCCAECWRKNSWREVYGWGR